MLFITLLGATFLIALTVSFIVVQMFRKPIDAILQRIISDEINKAWSKYLRFAMYVVGISSGVNLWKLEQYVTAPEYTHASIVELTANRWILEIYRTVIGAIQGIAWALLVFFIFALIAYVIVRVFELWKKAA